MSENIKNLVNAAVAGDRDAINEILKRYTSDMYFVTRLYVNNREDARNAEQFALRSAIRRLPESNEEDSFEEWLTGIVRDEALHQVVPVDTRSLRSLPYTTDDERADNSADFTYNMEECRIRILHVLDKLPESERAAAALYFYDGMSISDIARKLYLSDREVESLLTSAKAKINQTDISLASFLAMINRLKPSAEETEILPVSSIPAFPKDPTMAEEVEKEISSYEEPTYEQPEAVREAINEGTVEEVSGEIVIDEPIIVEEEKPIEEIEIPKAVIPEEEKPIEEIELPEPDFGEVKEEVVPPVIEEPKVEIEESVPEIKEKDIDYIEELKEPVNDEQLDLAVEKTIQEQKETVTKETTMSEPKKNVTKTTSKRKINPLHFLLILLLALILILGVYYFFFMREKAPVSPTPSNQQDTQEPTGENGQETAPGETSDDPQSADTNDATDDSGENKDSEVDETEEMSKKDGEVIGSLEVLAEDGINVRTEPSTDADIVEAVESGRKLDVYEITDDGTYTWYRIGKDKWLADGGGWVDYKKN